MEFDITMAYSIGKLRSTNNLFSKEVSFFFIVSTFSLIVKEDRDIGPLNL